MSVMELKKTLLQIKIVLLEYHQDKAESILDSFQDEFAKIFSKTDAFKYLGIVKNKDNSFLLELGYKRKGKWEESTKEMLNFIVNRVGNQIGINLTHKIKSSQFKEVLDQLPVKLIDSDEDFFYHSIKNDCSEEARTEFGIGSYINLYGESPGALGGFVELKNDNNIYILTNHHVIIKKGRQEGKNVYYQNRPIAISSWGIFDDYYDVALAKVYLNEVNNINFEKSKFGELTKPIIGQIVSKYGPCGNSRKGIIYSSKAIVCINTKLYKNQILIKNIYLNKGESGTVVKESSESISPVVGLHIGGDSKIDISNNLYSLFNSQTYILNNSNNSLENFKITFKSFINNLNQNTMDFKLIDTTLQTPQTTRIFDSRDYDLDCTFTLNNQKLLERIKLDLVHDGDDSYGLKSILFCDTVFPENKTIKVMIINMLKGHDNTTLEIGPGDDFYNSQIIFNTDDIIFTMINEYDIENEEKTNCGDIDLDDITPNPRTRNGSIIVGRP